MGYIYAYAPDENDCTSIGLAGTLLPMECTFSLDAGVFGELTLKHPKDPAGKWKLLQTGVILKAPVPVRLCPEIRTDGTYITTVETWTVSETATADDRKLYKKADNDKKSSTIPAGVEVTVLETSFTHDRTRIKASVVTYDKKKRKADIAAGKTCCDCVGACKGYAWNNGKKKSEVPDKSANGMFDWAKKKGAEWGAIGTIPEVPGIAVRFDGHVGYYVGNGYVIEWRGFNYGCVRTKLSGRKWTHWYRLPWIDYGEGALIKEYALGERDLRKGVFGNDVKELETRLMKLGYDLGKYGVDGDFGSDTQAAVIMFQTDNGLKASGVYDAATHKKLTGDNVINEPEEKPVISGHTIEIVSKNGGTVNVRVGNGTEYEIIKEVETGEVLEYIATAGNGWNAVKVGTQVGWVSGEYSRITE